MATDFIIGDSRPYTVNLTINDEPFVIDPVKDVVKAAIVSTEKKALSSAPVTLASTLPGADWATSKLTVKFPRASTAAIKEIGKALLEIQVTFDGLNVDEAEWDDWTWFLEINLVKATIS